MAKQSLSRSARHLASIVAAALAIGCGAKVGPETVRVTFDERYLGITPYPQEPTITVERDGTYRVRWELVADGELMAGAVRSTYGEGFWYIDELRHAPDGSIGDEHVVELIAGEKVTVRACGPIPHGVVLVGGYVELETMSR